MKFLIWLVLLFATLPVFGALTDFDRQDISFRNLLAPYNSGFEAGKASWTASTPAQFGITNTGSNNLMGKGTANWDAAASGDTLTSKAVTVPNGLLGRNCEASILVQVPTGTTTASLQAWDGTNILATNTLTASSTPTVNTVYFPCPSSGTIALRIYANANEASTNFDDAYLGEARNIGNVANTTPWTSYTPTGSWSTNTTYTGYWRRVGDTLEFRIRLALAGAPTATGLTINFLPNSYTIDTTKLLGTSAPKPIAWGTTRSAGSDAEIIGTYSSSTVMTVLALNSASTYLAASTSVTNTVPATYANGDSIELYGAVPITGWSSEQAFRPEQSGWWVSATIGGGNPSLGTASVSSFTELTNASLTMTPMTGSQPAGIMCSSTNAAATPTTSTSTCSAGSESLGIAVNIPVSGYYDVCADFSHNVTVDQAVGVNSGFEIIETPTNAQTLTQEGGSRVVSSHTGMAIATGNSDSKTFPHHLCGTFSLTAGTHGFRLMYEQLVGGVPTTSQILADESSTVGQRNFRFTVRPIASLQQSPLLVGGVTARDNSTGVTTVNTVVAKTTTYTATYQDETILASTSGGAWTLSLPAAASYKGKKYHIQINAASANALTVDPNASETVCGQTTVKLVGLGDELDIQSDGTNWIGLAGTCERKERARISSAAAITRQSTNWISSAAVTDTSLYTLTLVSGIFSAAPDCGCMAGDPQYCAINTITTSIVEYRIRKPSTEAKTADTGSVICIGPR